MKVAERAHAVATFRFVEVRLMEIAAAWTPTTPEMEAKVLLGKHVWDFAQHADALGRRTAELRLPEHSSRTPLPAYVGILDETLALAGTADRIAALYEVVLPGLDRRYRRFIADTDAILDAPTVVVLERIFADQVRQRAEASALVSALGLAAPALDELRGRNRALETIVDRGERAA